MAALPGGSTVRFFPAIAIPADYRTHPDRRASVLRYLLDPRHLHGVSRLYRRLENHPQLDAMMRVDSNNTEEKLEAREQVQLRPCYQLSLPYGCERG